MKIERGETYITFDESDGVEPEHLGCWKLVKGGDCPECGLRRGLDGEMTAACRLAGGTCLLHDGDYYARAAMSGPET